MRSEGGGEAYSVDELVRSVISAFRRHGLDAEAVEYPRGGRRSVDVVSSGGMVLKVSRDADKILREEVEDLKLVSGILGGAALIVSERLEDERLESGILMERLEVGVMSAETLDMYLSNEKVAIYSRRGGFFVKIDGEALRRKRIQAGLSIGELAELLRVSRKAVYEYERSSMDPSVEVAQRMVELLGEEVIQRVDLHELSGRYLSEYMARAPRSVVDKDPLLKKIAEAGVIPARLRRTAPDIVGRSGEEKLAMVVQGNRGAEDVLDRISNTTKICARLGCEILAIASSDREARMIEKEEPRARALSVNRLEEELRDVAAGQRI